MSATDRVNQIVFIDSRVPDISDLLDGLAPGAEAFLIDASSDGLAQVASILAAHHVSDLSSIAIVAHGESGALELGSSPITDGNLAADAAALTQIGAALAPGGGIQLYGCDVAQGAAGLSFINDFSTLAGGVPIDAATHIVGSADNGGSWTLDAASGSAAPDAANAPATTSGGPFTARALGAYQGALLVSTHPDGELFYLINNGPNNELGDINSTTATGSTVYTDPTDNETAVAVDPAAGLVFTPGRGIAGTGSYDAVVVRSAKTGAVLTTVPFGPNTGSGLTDDVVQAVAINPYTDTLYVGDWGTSNTATGVREFTYSPSTGALTPVATNGGFLFTAAQTEVTAGDDATTQFTNAGAMVLDAAHNLLYYVDNNNGYNLAPYHPTNGVYVVSTTGPSFSPTELTSNGPGTGQFPLANGGIGSIGANGNIVGLAVDVADGIVYFETTFVDAANSPNNALWWVNTTNTNQTATRITLPNGLALFPGQSNDGGDAAGLSFDPQTRQLYVTNALQNGQSPNNSDIYVLQLDSTGHNVTLVNTLGSQALLGQSPGSVNPNETPSATAFDVLPVLSVMGSSMPAVERGAAITIASSVTTTDADGNHLAGATVQITGGTFASNETSSNDDMMSVATGATTGTNITVSYNASTETLALTGYDTIANYDAVLAQVQYKATGQNPTNYGLDPTRTVTWTVSDGATNIPAGSQNSTTTTITIQPVNDPPILSKVAGTAASYTEAGAAPKLAPSAGVADPDNLNLAGATVAVTAGTFANDGDILAAATAGTAITASYNPANETLTLSGSDTLADYAKVLDSVTFSSTSQNPTDYGADATRQVTWTLNDGSAANNLSIPAISTVGITAVNNPPVLSGVTASVPYTAGAAAATLSPAVMVTDPDNLALAGATVAIAGGFSGDGDVLAATTTGTAITANYNGATETLTLSGSDTLANYAKVLDSVTFRSGPNGTNGGANPSRTVTWVVNDGSAANNLSTPVQSSIGITALPVTIVKTAATTPSIAGDPANTVDASGQAIAYTITVTNTGTQVLTNMTVTDPLDPASGHVVGSLASLALGAAQSFTFAYDATQADIDAGGAILNTATVTDSQNITQSASFAVPVDQHPSLTIVKTAASTPSIVGDPPNTVDHSGQAIAYTITVTNTGNETLTGLTVTDPRDPASGHVVGTLAALAVGASQSFTFSYAATQTDIDTGGVIANTATVTDAQNITQSASALVPVDQHPSLTIVKTAMTTPSIAGDPANTVDASGQVIAYTITVTNTGNETLTGLTVTDPRDPTSGHVVGTLASLAVGASQSFNFTYAATQADIDAGGVIVNTATVTDAQNITQSASAAVPVDQRPSLTIVKTAATTPSIAGDPANTVDAVGQPIAYTITVTNTGNQTLTNLIVTDPRDPAVVVGSLASLAVGASQHFTFTYAATQADIDAGGAIVNTATVTDAQNITQSASASVPVDQHANLTIVKKAATTPSIAGDLPNTVDAVGQAIAYMITVTNTGNETLTGLTVTDPRDPASGHVVGTLASLAVGASQSFSFGYAATQTDIDAGGAIVNTATVTDAQNITQSASAAVPVDQHPSLTIVKTAATTPSIAGDAPNTVDHSGQAIAYTITVTNTGNETLTGLMVTDPRDPTSGHVVGTLASLAVGASQSFSFSYAATQSDIDTGGAIANTATVTDAQNITQSASALVPVDQHPSLTIVKTAATTPSLAGDPPNTVDASGQVIAYTITVTNTGNETLSNLIVTDPRDPASGHVVGTLASLAVGASQSFSFSYAATQTDIDTGGVIANTATVTDAQNITQSASALVPIDQRPNLTIVKTAATTPSLAGDPANSVDASGQAIAYTITVTNAGNETLTGLTVTDPRDPISGHLVGTLASLAVGASQSFTFSYAATQTDIDTGGAIVNTATVTDAQNVTQSTAAAVPVDQHPNLALAMTVTSIIDANHDGRIDAGDLIDYSVVATNSGNVTLTSLSVTDALAGGTLASGVMLAPGASDSLTASHTLTQADIAAKTFVNTATATSNQAGPVSASASTPVVPVAAQSEAYWYASEASWKFATQNGAPGILLGDANGDLKTDNGETTLFVPKAVAAEIINLDVRTGGLTPDVRTSVLAQAIAAQLNIDAGAGDPGYNPSVSTAVTGQDLISQAVQWLTGKSPFTGFADGSSGNVDTNHNGVLDAFSEYNPVSSALTSPPVSPSAKAWTQQTAPGALSPTSVTTDGQGLQNALTAYNTDRLVLSLANFIVAWNPTGSSGAIPTDPQPNTPNAFWQVLQSQVAANPTTLHGIG